MPKEFYTEKDIEDLFNRGIRSLQVTENVVLTELAYEKAKRLDFQLITDHADNPPAAPVRPYISEQQTHRPVSTIGPATTVVESQPAPALAPTLPQGRSAVSQGERGYAVAEAIAGDEETEQVIAELNDFRVYVRRWLEAVTLPIDQLVLTLAQDIFTEAADLALAHKLALVLRKAADDHTEWRLPELTAELAVIAKNERRFIGFSSDDSGFDPEQHKGKVVVTTMHKAKGLEWDRVYLMSVNNYDFPSNQPNDRFISERWFLRNNLNLEAEALAQLNAATSSSEYDWYDEGAATLASRVDYVKERLRLFYVGITRAKKELIVTWNTGRQGDATPSLALSALMGWWESGGSNL
jgi:hypothetical protein